MDRDRHRPFRRLRALLVAAALGAAAHAAFFTTYRVAGASMLRTLEDGDRVWVLASKLAGPDRGDTVICELEGEILVKRLVAVPGDRVAMRDGVLVLNGREVDEDIPPELDGTTTFPEYALSEDEFFVLGDHRRVSVDSRDFGPLGRSNLVGLVLVRISRGVPHLVSPIARG